MLTEDRAVGGAKGERGGGGPAMVEMGSEKAFPAATRLAGPRPRDSCGVDRMGSRWVVGLSRHQFRAGTCGERPTTGVTSAVLRVTWWARPSWKAVVSE